MKFSKTIAIVATTLSLLAGAASTQAANPLASPVATATATSSPSTTVICTVRPGINANVRAGTSTRTRRLGTLRSGSRFICLGRVGNWLKIRFGGRTGWVLRSLVTCNRAI